MGRAVQSSRSSRPVSTTAGADQGEKAPSAPATRTRQVARSREVSGAAGQGTKVEAGPSRATVSVAAAPAGAPTSARAISTSARSCVQLAGALGTSQDRAGAAKVPPSTSAPGRWWSTRRRTGAASGPTGSVGGGGAASRREVVSGLMGGRAVMWVGMVSSGSSLNRFMDGVGPS
mgnify:CR=1 FL=1